MSHDDIEMMHDAISRLTDAVLVLAIVHIQQNPNFNLSPKEATAEVIALWQTIR